MTRRPSLPPKRKLEIGVVVFLFAVLALVSVILDRLPESEFTKDPVKAALTPAVVSSAAPAPFTVADAEKALSPQERARLVVLRDILTTGRDGDPRLDAEFHSLSENFKRAIRAEYAALPRERRSARGTLVFVLGRAMTSAEDFAFVGDVLTEPPCLSLVDCTKAPSAGDGHDQGVEEATMIYPQLVAIRALKLQYQSISSTASPVLATVRRELGKARDSLAPERVRQAAEIALRELTPR